MKFDTVIFDLGGVLINWEPRRLFRKIFDKEEEMEFFQLQLDGETVTDINVRISYNHRGIEGVSETMQFDQIPFLKNSKQTPGEAANKRPIQ